MELKKHNRYLYNSNLLKKFIANLAKGGKIQKIETIFFQSLRTLKYKIYSNPLILFFFVLLEVKPYIELRTLRLGSVSYQIPMPLIYRKQIFKAIKLLIFSINSNMQKISLSKKIQCELLLILQKKSSLYRISKNLYQTASNNRAFAHYRWGS